MYDEQGRKFVKVRLFGRRARVRGGPGEGGGGGSLSMSYV